MKKTKKKNVDPAWRRNRWLVGAAVFAAVGIVFVTAVLLLQSKQAEKVLSVGDSVIYRSDYTKYMNAAKQFGDNEQEARETLIDYLKNKQLAKEMKIPVLTEVLQLQKSNVASSKAENSEEAEDMARKTRSPWVDVLGYNNYIETFAKSNMAGKVNLGAYFHLPYIEGDKDRVSKLADSVRESLQSSSSTLSQDVKAIERIDTELPLAAASRSGIYMLDSDGSGLRFGGAFGVRPGLLPEDLLKEVSKSQAPFLSKTHHVPDTAFFFTHIVRSYDMGNDFATRYDDMKNGVRVVEYDR